MCGLNFTGGGLIRNADSLFHLSPAEWDWGWPRDLCFNQSPGALEVWVALAWMALWATRYIAMQESGEFKSIFPTLAVSTLGLFLPCIEDLVMFLLCENPGQTCYFAESWWMKREPSISSLTKSLLIPRFIRWQWQQAWPRSERFKYSINQWDIPLVG